MSTYLWKYYLENDIESFRQLLATANYTSGSRPSYAGTLSSIAIESPGKTSTSPLARAKTRPQKGAKTNTTLTRADINSKDAHGVTLLHLMASSMAEGAFEFGLALLGVSMLDLYIQDQESGWTALHRALYAGNVSLARAIMERDIHGIQGKGGGNYAGGLIKIKDHEGNSPFDVYATTIGHRLIPHGNREGALALGDNDVNDDDDAASRDNGDGPGANNQQYTDGYLNINGDQLFAFGSNKNLTLGFGDEDDRQFPEQVNLKRPQYIQDLFHKEHLERLSRNAISFDQDTNTRSNATTLPAVVDFKPIKVQDVRLSKLHTAVLTTDPESNLFVCGHGQGGRLGTGDESTRFNFTNISGGGLLKKRIIAIALGQNHTIAVTNSGEAFTWGNNSFGQLGYTVTSQTSQNDAPAQLFPRQIFGLLKREDVIGCAASRTHSVLFTSNSLYTFGKHDGQLGIIDSDARSLEMQVTPRKVAASLFSSPVRMVSAIDRATACLLDNHDVWVFANYGYTRVVFPLDGFSNYFLRGNFSTTHYDRPNHIVKICSGGDTICALGSQGDVYTVSVSQKVDPAAGSSSTTNPTKIKGALSIPQRIWAIKKDHMAVKDVDVGQDGSIIICTNSGSVWRRVKRTKIKDANAASSSSEFKPKDYKFTRIPGLTRIDAVRSNAFGAFGAVRKDCDVLHTQLEVAPNTLWHDVFPLLSFHDLSVYEDSDTENPAPRLWKPHSTPSSPARIRQAILTDDDFESNLTVVLRQSLNQAASNDVSIGSTLSDIRIPCHQFILMARSSIIRKGLLHFHKSYYFELQEVLVIEYDKDGRAVILFQGLDILTLVNMILYIYTDTVVSVWNHARQAPRNALRYRQVRTEIMKLAGQLDLRGLEHAARLMSEPAKTLHKNMDLAVLIPDFFEIGDVEIELSNSSMMVHSTLICQRCPFFEGLFHGRASGGWLASRKENFEEGGEAIKVDMKHVDPAIFTLVLRHLYSGAGEEIFEETTTVDLDTFLDLVLDVMAVANELMIDRLSQICQKVLGAYVNTRNVCQLLNAVAPCSVTEFKDAALEYICLNLEGMLENNLLDELDADLIADLDRVIRDNQLACLPIAKSGRAEAKLIEQYPELIVIAEKNKQTKIDSMGLRSRYHEDEAKMAKYSKSPLLKPRSASHDMMFNMDEDDTDLGQSSRTPSTSINTPQIKAEPEAWQQSPSPSLPNEQVWFDAKGRRLSPASASVQGRALAGLASSSPSSPLDDHFDHIPRSPPAYVKADGSPWTSAALDTPKLGMKHIMAQASENRQSSISHAFSQSSVSSTTPISAGKLSQKERKKLLQQQQQLQKALDVSQGTAETPPPSSKSFPWQVPARMPKISLTDELLSSPDLRGSPSITETRSSQSPSLTMRQTVSGNASEGSRKTPLTSQSLTRTSPHPSNSSPRRGTKTNNPSSSRTPPAYSSPHFSRMPSSSSHISSSPLIPQSIRHNPSARASAEPSLQISINDILSQQQIEKDLIKEASAKRSLQEIQEEQAFQEWWDQEERATRERLEMEEKIKTEAGRKGGKGKGGRGEGGVKGGRGMSRGGRAGGLAGRGRAGPRAEAVPGGGGGGGGGAEGGGVGSGGVPTGGDGKGLTKPPVGAKSRAREGQKTS